MSAQEPQSATCWIRYFRAAMPAGIPRDCSVRIPSQPAPVAVASFARIRLFGSPFNNCNSDKKRFARHTRKKKWNRLDRPACRFEQAGQRIAGVAHTDYKRAAAGLLHELDEDHCRQAL